MAAVLAVGAGAALSHTSAACLWKLPAPERHREVEVTVPGRELKPRRGIRLHTTARLDPQDRTTHHGIPVTRPARTLVDLASTLNAKQLARAVEEAAVQKLAKPDAILAALSRASDRSGAAALRAVLDLDVEPSLTRREAERRLLEQIRRVGLPAPRTNAKVGAFEVDLHWPAERLVVEMDSRRFHLTRAAFERDRARDAEHGAAGLRVMRFTWRQIVDEPDIVTVRIGQALARAA